MVKQTANKTIYIVDVACAWKPLVEERGRKKTAKYQHLKAGLAQQYKEEKYTVFVHCLWHLSINTGLLSQTETDAFLATAQRELLVQNQRLIKRHLVGLSATHQLSNCPA